MANLSFASPPIDFSPVCGMMGLIRIAGRAGSFFAGSPAPSFRTDPANDQHTQLDLEHTCGFLRAVASQLRVTPKINWLLNEFDGSRLLTGNGLHDAELNSNVPANETVKAYRNHRRDQALRRGKLSKSQKDGGVS